MTATTDCPTVSAAQYNVIYSPQVDLMTPQELLDDYADKFKKKGLELPSQDVDRLREFVPKQSLRFLLIPPRPDTLDLDGLMALIEVNGKKGKNHLDLQYLTDTVKTPTTAHLLLDVEDGRGRLNTKPSVSFRNIEQEGRLADTTWYGLVHVIVFPYMLQYHNLDLCGSRYRSESLPSLYLDDGIPKLSCSWCGDANPKWGAPSAGSVVGA